MCGCEKKNCGCQESTSTIRKKICVDIAGYDPDDVCKNKLVIKFADSCQVILGIDNCETVTPVLPSAPTNGYVTDSNGGSYDCGNPILGWTASPTSGVTYTIREGATVIASGVSANVYTVSGATAGVHSYTVEAVNGAGSSSVLTINAFVTACLSAPGNVTGTINVYDSGTATNYTCGLGFDVDFTDVSGATYYQLFEGATQIGSNSATSNFVITGQTAGSHTYTIKACNGVGCSTGTNFTVTVSACLVGSCRSGVGFPNNSGFVWNSASATTAMGLGGPGFNFASTTDTAPSGVYTANYALHFTGPAGGSFTFDINQVGNGGGFSTLYTVNLNFDGTGNYIGNHSVSGVNLINNTAILGQYSSSSGPITPVVGTCFTYS